MNSIIIEKVISRCYLKTTGARDNFHWEVDKAKLEGNDAEKQIQLAKEAAIKSLNEVRNILIRECEIIQRKQVKESQLDRLIEYNRIISSIGKVALVLEESLAEIRRG